MNTRLGRVLDEIQRTEEKVAVWQEHLKELHIRREQLENAEIIKSIRSMKLDSRQMLSLLEGIQNGTVSLLQGGNSEESNTENSFQTDAENREPSEGLPESEDMENEKDD